MIHHAGLALIRETAVIAIIRASSSDQLLYAADAIREGGLCVIEVTMTTPGALSIIEQAVSKYDQDVLFGAGTVLDSETARAAILAGAQFVVGPSFSSAVVDTCHRYSVPVIPGAYTPTEALTAWESGADMVKIFPASVGGPPFIRALKAPLPQLDLVPVGGVNLKTTAAFIQAGASAVGVGSSLVNQTLLDSQKFAEITGRSRRFAEEVERGRTS